jgi:hypothetical protein
MNAIDVLKKDHHEVHEFFSEYMSASDDDFARREELFQQIDKALLIHSDAEEQIFYPAVEKFSSDLVQEAMSEHQEVKQLLAEMLDLEIDDEAFDNHMIKLMERVENHVEEEEGPGGVMELAGRSISAEELDEMGRRIEQLKKDSEEELAA